MLSMLEKHGPRILRYVCEIYDAGSVSQAAVRLHLTQPTLTRQLRRLEADLGVKLFDRDSSGAVPTKAGTWFIECAQGILRQMDELERAMQAAAGGYLGRLNLGFVGSAVNGPLGAGISRLREELPEAEVGLHEYFDDALLAADVRNGSLDIAVHRLPVRHPDLVSIPYAREPMTVFYPSAWALTKKGNPLPPSALDGLKLIMWPRELASQSFDEVMAIYDRAAARPGEITTAQTVQSLLALVAAGVGIGVMADSYRTLRRVGVAAVPLRDTHTIHYLTTHARDSGSLLIERSLKTLMPERT